MPNTAYILDSMFASSTKLLGLAVCLHAGRLFPRCGSSSSDQNWGRGEAGIIELVFVLEWVRWGHGGCIWRRGDISWRGASAAWDKIRESGVRKGTESAAVVSHGGCGGEGGGRHLRMKGKDEKFSMGRI